LWLLITKLVFVRQFTVPGKTVSYCLRYWTAFGAGNGYYARCFEFVTKAPSAQSVSI